MQQYGFDDGPTFRSINLQVTDAFGPVVQSIAMPLTDAPPSASIDPGTFAAVVGGSASFAATVTDPSAADTDAGFSYAWSATANGSSIATGSDPTFAFSMAAVGSYDVSLTVTDKDGASSVTDYTFTVANPVPSSSTCRPPPTSSLIPAT